MDKYLCVLQPGSLTKFYVQEKCTDQTECILPNQIILELDDVLENDDDLLYPTEMLAGRTFQIDRKKKIDAQNAAAQIKQRAAEGTELLELFNWFKNYDRIAIEHGRCQRMGIPCHHDISALDAAAERKKDRINELNKIIGRK